MTWLAAAADRAGDRPALHGPGETLTYTELDTRAHAAAGVLAARGVGPGDRVALALEGGTDFAVALHACLQAGAVAMPIDVRLGEGERELQTRTAATIVDRPVNGTGPGGDSPPPAERQPEDLSLIHI